MMVLTVSALAIGAAVVAAAWPYLPSARPGGLPASGRAGWVNRLFTLAAEADAAGEVAVSAAARALIAALVAEKELPKKTR